MTTTITRHPITRHLRTRVFLLFGGFTLVLSLAYSGISIMVAYAVEDSVLDAVVEQESAYIEDSYSESGELVEPRVNYMQVYADLEAAPRIIRDTLVKNPRAREVFTDDDRHYHVKYLALERAAPALLVAEVTPLLIVSNLSFEIILLLMLILLAGLITAVWMAYRIAGYTTQPVQELAATVSGNEQTDEPVALPGTDSGDELAYLASTIEQSLNHLKLALKRESDFTRDVSHELRTPLTVIKNVLALAEQRPVSTQDRQQLEQASRQIERTVETLLTLAREESLDLERLAIRSLIEDCFLAIHQEPGGNEFKLDLDVPGDLKLDANRQLLNLLFNNLLENAIQHASEPGLRIFLQGDALVLENPMQGELVDNIFKQDKKGLSSRGLGHGLYLVERIVDTLGWRCHASLEQGQYQFHLHLPINSA